MAVLFWGSGNFISNFNHRFNTNKNTTVERNTFTPDLVLRRRTKCPPVLRFVTSHFLPESELDCKKTEWHNVVKLDGIFVLILCWRDLETFHYMYVYKVQTAASQYLDQVTFLVRKLTTHVTHAGVFLTIDQKTIWVQHTSKATASSKRI